MSAPDKVLGPDGPCPVTGTDTKSWATRVSRGVGNVTVEYDDPGESQGARSRRLFKGNQAARKFYAEMLKQGRGPRIVSAERT